MKLTEQKLEEYQKILNSYLCFGVADEPFIPQNAIAIILADFQSKLSNQTTTPEPLKSSTLPEYNEIIHFVKILSELEFREYWNDIQREAMQLCADQFKQE